MKAEFLSLENRKRNREMNDKQLAMAISQLCPALEMMTRLSDRNGKTKDRHPPSAIIS